MSKEITVCKNCAYFHNLDPTSPRKDVWYNHLCKANPLEMDIDPYDGKIKPFNINSLGMKYFTDEDYKYCRDINNGKCPFFKDKNGSNKKTKSITKKVFDFDDNNIPGRAK